MVCSVPFAGDRTLVVVCSLGRYFALNAVLLQDPEITSMVGGLETEKRETPRGQGKRTGVRHSHPA